MIQNYKKIVRRIGYMIAIGCSICLLFFIISCTWIGFEVNNQCKLAKEKYPGNCVVALGEMVNDETQSFASRNRAIWSLGQMGKAEALPVLQQQYTGIIPSREPLNQVISQYELKKAINLCSGGLNITSFIWKNSSL